MKKEPIAGWLLVFCIILVFGIIMNIINIYYLSSLIFSYPLMSLTLILFIALFFLPIKLLVDIQNRDKEFFKTLKWYFQVIIFLPFVDLIVSILSNPVGYNGVKFSVLLYVFIWRMYFMDSRRVKNTLSKNFDGKIF